MIRIYIALVASILLAGIAAIGGYSYGTAQVRAEFLSVQNSDLREARKETERQLTEIVKSQKVHNDQLQKIAASERRYIAADRLRQQAERAAAIATANVETCRGYAQRVTELFETCRSEYISLGHEAERSRAAVDALTTK